MQSTPQWQKRKKKGRGVQGWERAWFLSAPPFNCQTCIQGVLRIQVEVPEARNACVWLYVYVGHRHINRPLETQLRRSLLVVYLRNDQEEADVQVVCFEWCANLKSSVWEDMVCTVPIRVPVVWRQRPSAEVSITNRVPAPLSAPACADLNRLHLLTGSVTVQK